MAFSMNRFKGKKVGRADAPHLYALPWCFTPRRAAQRSAAQRSAERRAAQRSAARSAHASPSPAPRRARPRSRAATPPRARQVAMGGIMIVAETTRYSHYITNDELAKVIKAHGGTPQAAAINSATDIVILGDVGERDVNWCATPLPRRRRSTRHPRRATARRATKARAALTARRAT